MQSQVDALNDVLKASNDYLLTASKQGALLSAVVIASAGFWSESDSRNWITILVYFAMVGSMLFCGLAHFSLGMRCHLVIAAQASRVFGTGPSLSERQQKRLRKYEKSHMSVFSTPWIFGYLQAIFLAIGLILVAFHIASAHPGYGETSSTDQSPEQFQVEQTSGQRRE